MVWGPGGRRRSSRRGRRIRLGGRPWLFGCGLGCSRGGDERTTTPDDVQATLVPLSALAYCHVDRDAGVKRGKQK